MPIAAVKHRGTFANHSHFHSHKARAASRDQKSEDQKSEGQNAGTPEDSLLGFWPSDFLTF
jgi:hypothetical protein